MIFVLFAGILKGFVRVELAKKIRAGETEDSLPKNPFLPTIEKSYTTFGILIPE